jgi:hypothetical protein
MDAAVGVVGDPLPVAAVQALALNFWIPGLLYWCRITLPDGFAGQPRFSFAERAQDVKG